jgi:zinc/manganese transport system substrate-binding protein
MPRRALAALAALAVLAALAGCSGGAAASASGAAGTVPVVASTDVYGDIAESVGGDLVEVTSIIDSPAQDPHSYEASARDRLALARADLVIENGGGYDPFIGALLDAGDAGDGGDTGPVVLTAVEIAGDPAGNEHVWYDPRAMDALAHAIADALSGLDPANADAYAANAAAWASGCEALLERTIELADRHAGTGYLLTEPVPAYLLESAGLVNLTDPGFSEAIEEGTDVPPLVLQATIDLVTSGDAALLAYNSQTAGPETERVRAAAEAAGVPVVDLTETLPEGEDYLSWMSANLDRIAAALAA